MNREFVLPDLGEGLTEAAIVAWLVAPGDRVGVDQPVVELESAKSVVQLPTPYAGVVRSLGGEVGEVLHAGAVLLTLETDDTADTADGGTSPTPESSAASLAAGSHDESGAVLIGYGTRPTTASARPAGAPPRFGRRAFVEPPVVEQATAGRLVDAVAPSVLPGRRSPVVSPIVRRLARKNGFDASDLLGSGPEHLVVRADVERYVRQRANLQAQSTLHRSEAAATAPAPAPVSDASAPAAPTGSVDRRVPLDLAHRTAAAHFSRSRREIPEATIWLDADATPLLDAKRDLETATGERFGLSAMLARFAVAGLARHPVLNASYSADDESLVFHGSVNLGFAAQTPRGLMVPVVHGADRMSLRELRDALAARSGEAQRGAFPPDALAGGTFTLNNYGTLGVDGSAAIINHPESAMLGIGRLKERPWAVDGAVVVRTVVELTLAFDHRVCDGAEAAAFLTFVAGCVEHPIAVLAEL